MNSQINTKPKKLRGSNKINMTEGPIFPLMIRFAVPLLIMGILQVLFNAADIMVIGKFGGENSLAAVSSTSSITGLLVNLFIGMSVGTNVLCARYFGAGDGKSLSETAHTSIAVALIIGTVLTAVGLIFSESLLTMMGVPKDVLASSALYMRIYFIGMIPQLVYNYAAAILRSVGDTKRPLYFLTLSGVINVLLNLFLVIVCKLDVAGVAIATIVSQAVSAALTVNCLFHESGDVKITLAKLRIKKDRLFRIIRVGLPAGVQSTLFSLSNVLVSTSINSFGSAAIIAGNGAAGSIQALIFTALDSVYQAEVSFTGQNFGKRNYKRILKAQYIGQAIVYTFGFALCMLAVKFAEPLLHLYADDPASIAAGVDVMSKIASTVFIHASASVAVGTIRGLGYSLTPMLTSLITICGMRVLWVYVVFPIEKFHTVGGLFTVYPVSYFLELVVQLTCLVIVFKQVKKKYPPYDTVQIDV